MIIYNVTVSVEPEIHEEWWNWMKTIHLPEVLRTGRFLKCQVFRIKSHDAGVEGISYAIQYSAATMRDYDDYLASEAPALKQKTVEKYGSRILAFRTVLELVEEFDV